MNDPVMIERVRRILTNLEMVRENLLALSDDIWLSIDHNDQDALAEGYEFKRTYNDKMTAFDRAAGEVSELIQQFTAVHVEQAIDTMIDTANVTTAQSAENERIVKELDRDEPHSLDEDFCYMRPYGFVLLGRAFKDIVTWRRLYEAFCRRLATHDPVAFAGLLRNKSLISRRGNKMFTLDPHDLRLPLSLTNGIYAESNLSANQFRDNMKKLLDIFGLDPRELRVYLRQDRDA